MAASNECYSTVEPVLRVSGSKRIQSGLAKLQGMGKIRKFSFLGSIAFLGLAFCVFGWGLGYKLSLYNKAQTPSHQIPEAKLLSSNESSRTAKSPLVFRTRTSTRISYTAPTALFLVLLLAAGLLQLPALKMVENPGNKQLLLHRAILNTLFVRPPPVFI